MAVYVYRPLMILPTPWSNGTTSNFGKTGGTVHAAGIRAGTYPIRIGSLEGVTTGTILSLVASATMHNSAQGPTITPNAMREGTPTCTATTAMVTTYVTYVDNSTTGQPSTLSGAVPSGTFNYLGTTGTAVPFHFDYDVIVNPGSAFWVGTDITPYASTNLSNSAVRYLGHGATVGGITLTANETPIVSTATGVAIYFEELREPWSF